MTEPERRCPVHSEPGADEAHAWPCPDDCLDFLAELERRIEDVRVNGNFIRTWVENGVYWKQTFRNHEPVGEPERWDLPNRDG
jgi:hypothetical protein